MVPIIIVLIICHKVWLVLYKLEALFIILILKLNALVIKIVVLTFYRNYFIIWIRIGVIFYFTRRIIRSEASPAQKIQIFFILKFLFYDLAVSFWV